MQVRDWGFPGGAVVKNPPASEGNAGDAGSVLGMANHSSILALGNPMDRGA